MEVYFMVANREKKTKLDVNDADFAELLQVTEPPTPNENALVFHYSDSIDSWIAKNRAAIG
ncbi:MAG TPA: hypothetical protein VNG51_27310 [Ktedonobacteraceae bacterium]|nr:hypothetical protein [Ktedonobacteraceae bacterium]